eukprot:2181290-Pyramimonas_sp.AAC.1
MNDYCFTTSTVATVAILGYLTYNLIQQLSDPCVTIGANTKIDNYQRGRILRSDISNTAPACIS